MESVPDIIRRPDHSPTILLLHRLVMGIHPKAILHQATHHLNTLTTLPFLMEDTHILLLAILHQAQDTLRLRTLR